MGARGCQKKPQSYPRTAKVPQMVAQGCTHVSKGYRNGVPKCLKAEQHHQKGTAMTHASVVSTLITQKNTQQEVRTRALRNCTCKAQWRAFLGRARDSTGIAHSSWLKTVLLIVLGLSPSCSFYLGENRLAHPPWFQTVLLILLG